MMRVEIMRFAVGWLWSFNPGLKRQGSAEKPELWGAKKSESTRAEAY